MPSSTRLYRRFPVQCSITTYNAGLLPQLLLATINGHRTVRAGLGRGANHTSSIPLQDGTRDVDSAAVSLRRGAEYLAVGQRRVIGLHGDTARDRLWATGGRGRHLSVR